MTKEEIIKEVTEYFNGDSLAASVWVDKYALKDQFGDIKERTPRDMHKRLAAEFSRIEKNYPNPISEEKIFELFDKFRYIVPQGSPMSGVGNPYSYTSLSNCFVIGGHNADSYGGVCRTDEEQVQLMKRRGGVGHDLSYLRPSGSLANNAVLKDMAGSTLYAQRFSNSTKEVRQGDRRGALMLSMSIQHPDAERFIDSKLEAGKITDANISVRITDDFMKAVKEDGDFIQCFPIGFEHDPVDIDFYLEYDKLYLVEEGCYIKKVKAKKLWDKIIKNAWQSAEPGVLFWDNITRESPADCYEGFETVSTNPCGEIPLCPDDSCRLLLLNLYSYVQNPFSNEAVFDIVLFEEHAKIAQRLMDDLVDLEIEKVQRIIEKIKHDPESESIKRVELELWNRILLKAMQGRRTGLGVTGEGDMLAALGLVYGTTEATEVAVLIHKTLAIESYTSSIIMANERGAFDIWDLDKEDKNPFLKRIYNNLTGEIRQMYTVYGRRNIANMTISPAGTTSLMTQTTSGVEPAFAAYYKRRRRTSNKAKTVFTDEQGEMFEEYYVFHHKFIEWVNLQPIDWEIPLGDYTESELKYLVDNSPYHKATANDVNWVDKVRMQGAIQQWIDHSISATTNIPKETTVETVSDIYMGAYNSGCKGMTIYRDGSRSGILVGANDGQEVMTYIDAVKRPKELLCDIYHKTAFKQNWMILVGKLDSKPYEIFAFPEVENHLFPTKIERGKIQKMKSGVYKLTGVDPDSNKAYEIQNIISLIVISDQVGTRKYSLMLRHHIDPKWIVKDIEEYATITSFDKVVQRVLKNYIEDDGSNKCPECGGELTSQDGCIKCTSCGWSRCS